MYLSNQSLLVIIVDISIPSLAEQVVRGKVKLSRPQQRMLIELLPYYMPKLSAVALSTINVALSGRGRIL